MECYVQRTSSNHSTTSLFNCVCLANDFVKDTEELGVLDSNRLVALMRQQYSM